MDFNDILKAYLRRRYLLNTKKEQDTVENQAAYAVKLLNTFGVSVDKPHLLTAEHVKQISEEYKETVPKGFYDNPQDLKHYTSGELETEKAISYFKIELTNHGKFEIEEGDNPFKRDEVFEKILPDYEKGTEVKLREYQILSGDEIEKKGKEIRDELTQYTRKWNDVEENEFHSLTEKFGLPNKPLRSKDNAIAQLLKDPIDYYGKSLDTADIGKLSVQMIGETPDIEYTDYQKLILTVAISNAKDVPMTKKQAKYYNAVSKNIGLEYKSDNLKSPYKLAREKLNENDPVGAAKEFAKYGSLLERNLRWILSRADNTEVDEILDLVDITNPVVGIQLLQMLSQDNGGPRTFSFYSHKGYVQKWTETEEETKKRKSIILPDVMEKVSEKINDQIDQYFRDLPSLGKVYIDDSFEKIAVPLNTSASGVGLDVLPVGSRLPIKGDYIRAFTHWEDVFDIDSSVVFIDEKGSKRSLYWGNYDLKQFGDSALTNGDDRGKNGTEYIDFNIDELRDLGYLYGVYMLNGFEGRLNVGTITTGYQNKENINTEAWAPDNIEMQIDVNVDSRSMAVFGIDFSTREIVILNTGLGSEARAIAPTHTEAVEQYMNEEYLKIFNVHRIASLRAEEIVDNPEDADVVFSDKYKKENDKEQNIIRGYDIEKIVNLL